MLRARAVARSAVLSQSLLRRGYASASSPHALVLLEQRGGVLESGSLSALTAAQQLGGKVTGLIIGGSEVDGAVGKAKKCVVLANVSADVHLTGEQAQRTGHCTTLFFARL
jgi:electron transfer flavoprotein alpha subunit